MKINFLYILLIILTINLSFSTDPFKELLKSGNYNRPLWNNRDTKKLIGSGFFTILFMILYKKKIK